MDDLKIAAVCMEAEPGELERNLERIRAFASEASGSGAHMVCFPELSLTGYMLKHPEQVYERLTQEEAVEGFVHIARQAGVVLIGGLIEITDGHKPYITQLVAGPHGIIGSYRKTHLSPQEKESYREGERISVFSYGNGTFGVQLCYESHFPEISTAMAIMGASVIFFPHASPRGDAEGKLESWLRHLPARAFDNGVYVVACNQAGGVKGGLSFPGVVVILSPDGQVLSQHTGGEAIVYGELSAGRLNEVRKHRMKYFIPNRRPELYRKILYTPPQKLPQRTCRQR